MNEVTNLAKTYSEADMYAPVKDFLERQGFAVNAEVRGCDVVATYGEYTVIVELKRSFVLKLVYQGIERQKLTPLTFLCIPRPKSARSSAFQDMLRLVKRLGLGLMFVAMDSPLKRVEVVVLPNEEGKINNTKLAAVLHEAAGRISSTNIGGSTRRKISTAYREHAIKIACIMETVGEISAKELVDTYGCEKNALAVVSRNTYGWFERTRKGVYALSQEGCAFLDSDMQFEDVIKYYREHSANL